VGTEGQNYLNLCASFESPFEEDELKEAIIHPIESQLGRRRSADKYAPRPIDVDIVLFDDQPAGDHIWDLGYVIVPLAELYPEYRNPKTGESIYEIATRLRRDVWLETRQGVIG
jgi:2-amino-4-hydroxy-6-hydroxymethyldihydropteridine diphosphokinase